MEKYSATSDRHANIQVLGNLCESTKVLASYYLKVKIIIMQNVDLKIMY